ncbi:type II secretion system protein [Acinetobacter guillouiae]|uniref:type II secretion system protein n=1 Tax=Acinetobacter guillouiae TaxID=106649 RepID=UPI0028E216F6|nr:type II secretion system protein [Acinetobacter guillouiae]
MVKKNGFTTIGMLIIVLIMIYIIGNWVVNYSFIQKIEKERELIRIGLEYKKALQWYRNNSPYGVYSYPIKLEDLTYDPRYSTRVVRYLRKIEKDPITNQSFELIKNEDGEIVGVYSSSSIAPLKSNFDKELINFNFSKKYSDWKFIVTNSL